MSDSTKRPLPPQTVEEAFAWSVAEIIDGNADLGERKAAEAEASGQTVVAQMWREYAADVRHKARLLRGQEG